MNPSSTQRATDLVLVGGGHTHIQVLEGFAMEPPAGVRTTVIVDTPTAMYSGMVPGFVAGQYRRAELEIDVLPLARRVGARVIFAPALSVDPEAKRIAIEGRPPIAYDIASFDIGSTVAGLSTPGVREHAIPTRPIGRFVVRVDSILDDLGESSSHEPLRIVVAGAGAGGVELAFGMGERLRNRGHAVEVTLVESGEDILSGYSRRMRSRVLRAAERCGIRVITGTRVQAVEPGQALLESTGEDPTSRFPFDILLWVTGATSHPLFRDSNLPTDERGFVKVRSTLQLQDHDDIFAVGDCATLSRYPKTPKAGVYAVRQGPVLTQNLRRALAGGSALERYRPQHDFLTLINTGDGRAIGAKWNLAFEGRWVFSLKDHIDRKFMRRFQPLDLAAGRTVFDRERMDGASTGMDPAEMLCGGCAAKLGQSSLEYALARLDPPPPDGAVELGLLEADDATCTVAPDGQRIVSSCDQFRAFTDDPYLVGRVGAVNAASDVIAKGVEPRFAHALVALPEALANDQREEALFQLMAGARTAFDAMGVSLIGGHTTTATELLVGFHVEGFAEPDQPLLRIDRLAPDRDLVLAKALGTGVVLRADMLGRARGLWFERALASMVQDNREAAAIAIRSGAVSATDVSGFGLAGHLSTMLRSAGVAAVVDIAALPVLPGALELLGSGVRSTFHEENAKAARGMKIAPQARTDSSYPLLFDPQTAGGLLFDLPCEATEDVLCELAGAGYAAAAIGRTLRATESAALLEIVRRDSDNRQA